MARIANEKIELIKSKINIVDVISQYLKLEKRGRNYWGVCPFHQDSNPSMSVNPDKQIYRCFSCAAGGNVFTFLQDYKHITFLEALRDLALQTDVDLAELNSWISKEEEEQLKYKRLYEINNIAKEYYLNNIFTPAGDKARAYLHQRQITDELINEFEIGYAGKDGELLELLAKKGYSIPELEACGLVDSKNKIQLTFYKRIMFPIANEQGQIIGFSGRVFEPGQAPKYVNTPETVIFKKQELMYHFHLAKPSIRLTNSIIILEGYMDVIALNRLGIQNTVALMGTNLSNFHLKAIKNAAEVAYLFLDGDGPGITAAIKASVKLLSAGLVVKVVDNHTPNDPDELVCSGQGELVKTMIERAVHPVMYLLSKKVDINQQEKWNNYLAKIILLLDNIQDEVLRDYYLNQVATSLAINKELLAKRLAVQNSDPSYHEVPEPPVSNNQTVTVDEAAPLFNNERQPFRPNRYYQAEAHLILSMLWSRRATEFFLKNIGYLNFTDFRLLANYIVKYYETHQDNDGVDLSVLCRYIDDEHLVTLLQDIYNKTIINHQYREKALLDYKNLITQYTFLQDLEMLKKKQQEAPTMEEKISLAINIQNLAKKIKK